MKSIRVIGLVILGLSAGGPAFADDYSNFAAASPWGRYFNMAPFQSRQLDVTVATDKATGQKVNLVKLPNGHMMVMIPADRFMALHESTPTEDMMPGK